jgi:hypothetical protein
MLISRRKLEDTVIGNISFGLQAIEIGDQLRDDLSLSSATPGLSLGFIDWHSVADVVPILL